MKIYWRASRWWWRLEEKFVMLEQLAASESLVVTYDVEMLPCHRVIGKNCMWTMENILITFSIASHVAFYEKLMMKIVAKGPSSSGIQNGGGWRGSEAHIIWLMITFHDFLDMSKNYYFIFTQKRTGKKKERGMLLSIWLFIYNVAVKGNRRKFSRERNAMKN